MLFFPMICNSPYTRFLVLVSASSRNPASTARTGKVAESYEQWNPVSRQPGELHQPLARTSWHSALLRLSRRCRDVIRRSLVLHSSSAFGACGTIPYSSPVGDLSRSKESSTLLDSLAILAAMRQGGLIVPLPSNRGGLNSTSGSVLLELGGSCLIENNAPDVRRGKAFL